MFAPIFWIGFVVGVIATFVFILIVVIIALCGSDTSSPDGSGGNGPKFNQKQLKGGKQRRTFTSTLL